jgi:hypothetical protein
VVEVNWEAFILNNLHVRSNAHSIPSNLELTMTYLIPQPNGRPITMQNGKLVIPDNPIILLLDLLPSIHPIGALDFLMMLIIFRE